MTQNRIFRTTAIRLALRYAIFYALLTGLGLGLLYWATTRYVDAQITASLNHQLNSLKTLDARQGRDNLIKILSSETFADIENKRYLLLVSSDNKKIAGSLNGWPPTLKADKQVRNIWIDDDLIPHAVADKDGFWPMIATTLADGSRLLVAQSVRQAEDLQEFILTAMGLILAVTVGLTLIMGFRFGKAMLSRVDHINATARSVQAGDLSQRVLLTENNDEFDELGSHLNKMLLHIEQLVKGMQEVTDNVAHDLRRPLSRLQNRIEVTLQEAQNEDDYRQTMEESIDDIQGMIRTFNALLEIAQAEAGSYRGEWQSINLSQLAHTLADLYEDTADANQQQLETKISPDIMITCNQHLIGQLISNLLENAIKHAGKGSHIQLSLSLVNQQPLLSISDTGIGIAASEHDNVLKRFVRLDKARSTTGNGLGLSLVAAVAKLHKATLTLHDNYPGLRVDCLFK
jgi:signal transduction histidine kinase